MRSIFLSIAIAVITFAATPPVNAQSLEDNQNFHSFMSQVRSIRSSIEDGDKLFPMEFVYCLDKYEKLIASGVSPTARVEKYAEKDWNGTIAEIKEKYCVAAEKKGNDDWDAKQAPYKAALKADKLRLIINENSRVVYSYALAGGKYTDDAKALAAARVWFLDVGPPSNEAQNCLNGGRRNTVRRYTFDINHKLLSTTEKAYCGTPPASAYR
ncbi:MAG: hypothetical protein AB7V18_18785 [Pyrinomonadaceae bacterium]